MKFVLKKLYRWFLRLVPNGQPFDRFIAFLTFFRMHRRFPVNRLMFNDVIYRIKTTDEIIDPLRVFVSDKEFVKLYVKAIAGDQYNVPTFKVLHTAEEISNYDFPAECCIKPTHMSGQVILRKQGMPVDIELIKRWLNVRHYDHYARERNYKNLKPKVIVEPLVFGSANATDYKIFCYKGKPGFIQIDLDRYIEHTELIFDAAWNVQPFSIHYPKSRKTLAKPKNLDEMLDLARKLSANFGLIRVDLYSDGESCMVGELTNCPGGASGFVTGLYSNGAYYSKEEMTYPAAEKLASELLFGKQQPDKLR